MKNESDRKLYLAVKIGPKHEERLTEQVEYLKNTKFFDVLEVVDPKRFHVTTAFLGEVDEKVALDVLYWAQTMAPFDCFLGEPMTFGPKVGVLRAYGSGLTVMNRLQGERFMTLTGRNLSNGYKYVPHITIAKAEGGGGSWADANAFVRKFQDSPMMEFHVDRVGLYHKSELLAEARLEGHAHS